MSTECRAQGVERYLDKDDQANGTYNNSTFPQDFWQAQAWKKDVPLIAGRPARFTVHMLTQGTAIPFGTAPTAKNKLTLVLSNPGKDPIEIHMRTATFTAPTVGTSFGESDPAKVAQFDVNPADLTDQTTLQVKVTLDPTLGIDPVKGVANTVYGNPVLLNLKYMPKMEVHLVSIDYTYRKNGTLTTVGFTDAELAAFKARIKLEDSIKALFPVSHIDAAGAKLIEIKENPERITAGWNEETPSAGTNGAPRGPFYIADEVYKDNIEVMREELKTSPSADPIMRPNWAEYERIMGPGYRDQNNVYIIGVCRAIQGRTYTSTPNASFTSGLSQRGGHWSWILADINESGSTVAATRAATTAVHELGHANGAGHSPSEVYEGLDPAWGYNPFPYAPNSPDYIPMPSSPLSLSPTYAFGGIGGTGWFFGTSIPWRIFPVKNSDKDLMSYSPDSTRWISDYNFTIFFKQQKNINDFVQTVTP